VFEAMVDVIVLILNVMPLTVMMVTVH
jgi:hypothetical protein